MKKLLILSYLVVLLVAASALSASELFCPYQTINFNGPFDFESFSISGETYLAVGGYYNDGNTCSGNVEIYKWNSGTKSFLKYQVIPNALYVRGLESFMIENDQYLVIARHTEGNNQTHLTNSFVYKWNADQLKFELYQQIPTQGAIHTKKFMIGANHYLAVANSFNNYYYSVDSEILKWEWDTEQNKSLFKHAQYIPTFSASKWESIDVNGTIFLAVANDQNYKGAAIQVTSFHIFINGIAFLKNLNRFRKLQHVLLVTGTALSLMDRTIWFWVKVMVPKYLSGAVRIL